METTLELFPVRGFERIMDRCKLRADTSGRALFRGLVLAIIAWGPMALWSLLSGNAGDPLPRLRFFNDFAAYAQFWIALPMFSLAQVIIGRRISWSVSYMSDSGFVARENAVRFSELISKSQKFVQNGWIEVICLLAAYITPAFWLSWEFTNGKSTWHALVINGAERVTTAGLWEAIIAIPLYWFLIYRWIWRIIVWSLTLYKISRLKLQLKASHPDSMGGLGFISNVQANFGILIFVFGCVIAATVFYGIIFEKVQVSSLGVLAMIVPFMIIAPIAFVAPLLVFTPLLLRLRMKSQFEYCKLGLQYTEGFERKWIKGEVSPEEAFVGSGDIQSLADLTNAYENTMSLKIIPFDFKNLFRLVASAFGPMIPVIAQAIPKESSIGEFLSMFF